MHWGIEFYRDEPIDETFVHGLMYRLVAEGARYNAAKYPGKFFITGISDGDISKKEERIEERTHKLGDIVTEYCSYDTSEVSLTVHLNYVGDHDFYFEVGVRPCGDATVVSIRTSTDEIESDEAFVEFVTLCKRVIESFEFVHCRYTNENRESLSFDSEVFVDTPAEVVTYYADDLVGDIGRERLVSAPVESVEEMDGGIFLLACIDPFGACEGVERLREHLGQKKYR